MAVSVTNQSNPLGSKLVQDTDCSSTAVDNATGGTGNLYAVEITNPNGSPVYFKLADSANATAGTTAADIVLECPANQTRNIVFVGGIAFTVGFSHWCVTAAAEASAVAPASAVTASYVIGA